MSDKIKPIQPIDMSPIRPIVSFSCKCGKCDGVFESKVRGSNICPKCVKEYLS